MEFQFSDLLSSVLEQYPDAVAGKDESAHSLTASGARVVFGTRIKSPDGSSIEIDLLRRAADGVGWDVIEVQRPQISYEAQIEKLRSAARALDASGIRIYSFIYLSPNPESSSDSAASKWTYVNVSREVLDDRS